MGFHRYSEHLYLNWY